MNIFDLVVPILFFFVGLKVLHELPLAQEDPLRTMNQRSAPTL